MSIKSMTKEALYTLLLAFHGALLALRGVGGEHSAGFAMAQRLEQPWQDVPAIVARHIRKARPPQ